MSKAFASQGDMTEKKVSFTEIGEGLYAFTAEGDPNSGVIIGEDSVMVIEAQATPRLARKVVECIRQVTDKPISHLVLTHYHAVRVLGASAYGAREVIMSDATRAMVVERLVCGGFVTVSFFCCRMRIISAMQHRSARP